MDTFLHSVAKFIFGKYHDDLRSSCVVFPNQRSAVYFWAEIKNLNKLDPQVLWLPHSCTIDEFVHSIGNFNMASQVTLLSALYSVHQNLTHSGESFDRFFPWAQTILADFDDIDKYLVDPNALLQNVQDIKNLDNAIDYLTDEQRKVLSNFFHVVLDGDSKLKERFLDIWQILLPLYDGFQEYLKNKNLSYDGQVYRMASELVGEPNYKLPYSKVFFIGFNAITKSEEKIFETLQGQDKALFFWDYDNSYVNDALHEAGFFMRRFVNKFKSPEDFVCNHDFDIAGKNINIVASPTISGQISVASEKLSAIKSDEIVDTALVLSDEAMLMNVLEHVSPYVSDLNVTMGYKVKDSVAGQWMELLMQLQSNKRAADVYSSFYYKNVLALLQHPFFISVDSEFAESFSKRIKEEMLFQVPVYSFADNDFAKMLFSPIDNSHDFSAYVLSVLKKLMSVWEKPSASGKGTWQLQQELVYRMILQIQQLEAELTEEMLVVELPTYFKILRKCINSLKVPFEGEPIKGLQVMGFLETRNLDFKNLIILNVNEGTLPVDGNTPSFIPYSFRRFYGLPTHEEREAMYAYYFYRLIQRAENITLTYFVGKADGKNGEPSRYVMQMIYGGYNYVHKTLQSNISFAAGEPISIEKSNHTMKLLDVFISDGKNEDVIRPLSPSSLVIYQKCPLQFYFGKILRLSPDDDIDENIDARQFGNIFHDAMHMIYSCFLHEGQISGADIRSLSDDYVQSKIDIAFANCIYFPNSDKQNKVRADGHISVSDLNGNNMLVYNVIKKYVSLQLEYDAAFADNNSIEFIDLEGKYSMDFPIVIDGERIAIRLGGTIDRIDKVNDEVRIIDYKTGKNDIICNSVNDVFDPENIDKYKGILQTLIYCLVYNNQHPVSNVLSSYLFKTTELNTGIDFKIHSKASKDKQDAFADGNYLRVSELVNKFVVDILSDIFDKNKPFVQTDNVNECKKCNFFYFCGK